MNSKYIIMNNLIYISKTPNQTLSEINRDIIISNMVLRILWSSWVLIHEG
jgi:hypothetical protein